MGRAPVNGWGLPIALTLIFLAPGIFGTIRVGALALEWDWALAFAAEHVDNLPLFLHSLFAVVFLGLGAVQLLPGTRARYPEWHRCAGRVVVLSGLLAAASGVWMTLAHPGISGALLYYARIVFGVLWAVFLLAAVRAILFGQVPRHRAFMIRAYALAANAGTLPFIYLPLLAIYGEPAPAVDDAIQVAGWIINLSLAEWFLRRKPRRRAPALQPQTV